MTVIPDPRDPGRIKHERADILRARILAIACGYPDADDLDHLRHNPALKLACGKVPHIGDDLASQPTVSRWENAPELQSPVRLGRVLVDQWRLGHRRPPGAVKLDIDDTLDVAHGNQQLALLNAHEGERRFRPIHVSIRPAAASA